MGDYQFGTLVFLPAGDLRQVCDELRQEFDPVSAISCAAHITITQPFTKEPNVDQLKRIIDLVDSFSSFNVQIGPAVTSPNKKLIWFDVNPKEIVLMLRELLHDAGLFRTDLPLTKGFIPHLTISEDQRDPETVSKILQNLNSKYSVWNAKFDSISWIVPDEKFVFKVRQVFPLGEG